MTESILNILGKIRTAKVTYNDIPASQLDIIEDAIAHSSRPRPSTFFAILGGKRYDYEDMIILRENDFQKR